MNALLVSFAALFSLSVNAADATSGFVLHEKSGHLYHYSGSAQVDGVAERRTDEESLKHEGDNLCFVVAEYSRRFIPREGDSRAPWFCFSRRDAALRALRLPPAPAPGTCGYRLTATVVIGNYVANRKESEVFDTATLLAVKSRGKMQAIPCK
jgi:hypothetical protein